MNTDFDFRIHMLLALTGIAICAAITCGVGWDSWVLLRVETFNGDDLDYYFGADHYYITCSDNHYRRYPNITCPARFDYDSCPYDRASRERLQQDDAFLLFPSCDDAKDGFKAAKSLGITVAVFSSFAVLLELLLPYTTSPDSPLSFFIVSRTAFFIWNLCGLLSGIALIVSYEPGVDAVRDWKDDLDDVYNVDDVTLYADFTLAGIYTAFLTSIVYSVFYIYKIVYER